MPTTAPPRRNTAKPPKGRTTPKGKPTPKQPRNTTRDRYVMLRVLMLLRAVHAMPTVNELLYYGALSDELPWPSQATLARKTGRCERTVRRHLALLERLGILAVYRTPPHQKADGTYTRSTNRYLLKTVAAAGMLPALAKNPAAFRRLADPETAPSPAQMSLSNLEDTGVPKALLVRTHPAGEAPPPPVVGPQEVVLPTADSPPMPLEASRARLTALRERVLPPKRRR